MVEGENGLLALRHPFDVPFEVRMRGERYTLRVLLTSVDESKSMDDANEVS